MYELKTDVKMTFEHHDDNVSATTTLFLCDIVDTGYLQINYLIINMKLSKDVEI